ncbi:MAG: S46 family peptidase [Chitinophagaceae bacterium]
MKNIFKSSVMVLLLLVIKLTASADEGMWLPQLLQSLNEKEMKKMGMKINASDIYSINKSSLKDAIVSLGGFCTAEVISDKGLLLTNHHCGFDAIQNHSTLQNNYIKDGFWSKNTQEELTNPGLTATFIISIEDVTEVIKQNLRNGMSEKDRQSVIDKTIAEIRGTKLKKSYQDILNSALL